MDWIVWKQQVKSAPANEIANVVAEHLALTVSGPTFKAPCPFHSDTGTSFDVDPRRQRYRCWGCNRYGDVITFIQEYRRISFQEALEFLAKRAGISMPNPGDPQCVPNTVRFVEVQQQLLTDKDKAAILFLACMEMSRKGTAIDLVTLSSHLNERGLLDRAGGPRWLADLWDTSANWRQP